MKKRKDRMMTRAGEVLLCPGKGPGLFAAMLGAYMFVLGLAAYMGLKLGEWMKEAGL